MRIYWFGGFVYDFIWSPFYNSWCMVTEVIVKNEEFDGIEYLSNHYGVNEKQPIFPTLMDWS